MKRRTFLATAASAAVPAAASVEPVKRTPAPNAKFLRTDTGAEPVWKLTVATCQFPVTDDIGANLDCILRQMNLAKREGCDVAHFSETALGGYAGVDFSSFEGYDWKSLESAARQVIKAARSLGVWVILGSNHRLSGSNKPRNSLYVIDPAGKIVDRYDKMFCTGNSGETSGDLKHYSPGERFVTVTINGFICGLQICHDMRYPEMYRELKQLGTEIVFHSYYNGRELINDPSDPDENIWGVITEPTMQTYAAVNNLWISANNTSKPESCWPSFVVRPDGVVAARLERNAESMLITEISTAYRFYDASAAWRERAMNGIYHSGTLVDDPRGDDVTSL